MPFVYLRYLYRKRYVLKEGHCYFFDGRPLKYVGNFTFQTPMRKTVVDYVEIYREGAVVELPWKCIGMFHRIVPDDSDK